MHYIIAECGFLKISPGNVGRKIREHIESSKSGKAIEEIVSEMFE